VPVHSAVPTASSSQGWLTGRGSSRARPLPAHSRVTGAVTTCRRRSSSMVSDSGRSTRPPTSSRQLVSSAAGMSKWISR
jgi:hypothetical protein